MVSDVPRFRALQALRSLRAVHFVLGCLVLVSSAGCHYWQPEPAFPQRPARHAEDVRITLYDGSRLFMERVAIVGDSLVGTAPLPDGNMGRRAVALAEVRKVEGRWLHPGRTGGLVFGITLVVALGLAIAAVATMGSMGSISMGSGF